MRTFALAIISAVAIAGTSYAQSPTNQGNGNPAGSNFGNQGQYQGQNQQGQNQQGQNVQAMQRQFRTDLEQAGFTDIRIMPESFLVRAKDKKGNPVMMVINPDSITAITEIQQNPSTTTGSGNRATTGSGQPGGVGNSGANVPGGNTQPGNPH